MNVPGIIFDWVKSVDEFKSRTNTLINDARAMYDSVGSEKIINFSNIGQKLSNFDLKFSTELNILQLYQSVHIDKTWRDASMEADKVLSDLNIELGMRKDVFDKFVYLKENEYDQLSKDSQKYIDDKIKEGKKNGLHCSNDVRKQIEEIAKELSKLEIEFSKNLSEENDFLIFSLTDLDGCPDSFISSLEKVPSDNSKVRVTLKYPHVFPLMKYAKKPETRRRMDMAFNSRCKATNDSLLKQMIVLRHKRAKLLDFDTHANYILDRRMAKNKDVVWNFLQDLRDKLKPLKDAELAQFLKYKRKLHEDNNWEFNNKIDNWDLRYFMNQNESESYKVDHQKLKKFFPLHIVTKGMFSIYQTLLGLKFEKIDGVEAWHEDVEMFRVLDSDSKNLMGYFFLDLHPREGKYGHAQVRLMQVSGLDKSEEGNPKRQIGVVTMLANFSKPTGDGKPILLNHDEVTTYFHEFGHIMHGICCQVDYSKLLSFNVEWDFVECPSQMLENWCWEAEGVKLMSSHYDNENESIGDELLNKLQQSRVANAGVLTMRQVCLAAFDQLIHTDLDPSTVEPADVYSRVMRDYLGIDMQPGTNMPATFGHMGGSYDAQYYGYLWSEVFAADMFLTRFKKAGILDPKTGRDYRNLVLKPGASKDANQLILDFLGRVPTQDAFLQTLGLKI